MINNAKSDSKAIVCGVCQGSVLGFHIFSLIYKRYIYIYIYIYIYKSAPKVCFHLFSDDASLFYSNKSWNWG